MYVHGVEINTSWNIHGRLFGALFVSVYLIKKEFIMRIDSDYNY
jgi:hypothetical protein